MSQARCAPIRDCPRSLEACEREDLGKKKMEEVSKACSIHVARRKISLRGMYGASSEACELALGLHPPNLLLVFPPFPRCVFVPFCVIPCHMSLEFAKEL